MNSIPFRTVSVAPHTRKKFDMSYTFGPHTKRKGEYVLYGGDGRVVEQDPKTMIVPLGPTPRWLIADWILADAEGQPVSPQARAFLNSDLSSDLEWLRNFCQEK